MYCASLPRHLHTQDLVDKELSLYKNSYKHFGKRKRRAGRAMCTPPHPAKNRRRFLHHAHRNILYSGIHSHCLTCRKPPRGYHGCRLNKPSGLCECTNPVILYWIDPDTSGDPQENQCENTNVPEWKVEHEIPQPDSSSGTRSLKRKAIDIDMDTGKDGEVLVWEIKRPKIEPLPGESPPLCYSSLNGTQLNYNS